jgi:NAD-dependent dihydropyrimidine dehydrogenase PreA subunit
LTVWKNDGSTLGIFGTNVAVDLDLCVGDAACIEVCPVDVFEEWYEQNPLDKKVIPEREQDCIYCFGCEAVCPKSAILVTPKR